MSYSKMSSAWILQIARNLGNKEKNHGKGFSKQMCKHYPKAGFKKTQESKLLVRQGLPREGKE